MIVRRRAEAEARVAGSRRMVFARLDDQTRLAEHMGRSSLVTGGGRMTYQFDAARGQAVGSHIKMSGQAFGLSILLDEVVVERHPPSRKVWRTTGTTRLVVIGDYEMGFEVNPVGQDSDLRVWIDYDPPLGPARWVRGLGAFYARWCVRQMVGDAVRHFAPASVAARPGPG